MDSDIREPLRISLSGPFALRVGDGGVLALRSLKAQGCLALLATAPDLRRSRAWLADRLWSDRGTEQAFGSLRQVLSELRRSLGEHAEAVCADRRHVWLDPDLVSVEAEGEGEFLEGIDIRDAQWEEWLREQRARRGDEPLARAWSSLPAAQEEAEPAPRILRPHSRADAAFSLSIVVDGDASDEARFIGGIIAETLARNLLENAGISAAIGDDADSALRLCISPHRGGMVSAITISLRRGRSGYLWSGTRSLSQNVLPGLQDPALNALIFEAQDAAVTRQLEALPRAMAEPPASLMAQLAVRKMFTFDAGNLRQAAEILERVCDAEPTPVSIGWLLMLHRTLIYERLERSSPELLVRLDGLCAQAMEHGSSNAFVLANVSSIYLRLLGRPDEGVELARRAARLNPSNPFAIDAMASAQYLSGRSEEGYLLSRVARAQSMNTSISHFFDMSLCLAATLTGRHAEALSLARSTVAMAPKFRAGWRYLLAHSAHRGAFEEVSNAVRRLRALETDFTPDRLLADPEYPIYSIRAAQLDLSPLRKAG